MQYLEDVDPIIDFSIAKGFSDRVVFCQLNIPIQAVVKCTCDLGCQYFELPGYFTMTRYPAVSCKLR